LLTLETTDAPESGTDVMLGTHGPVPIRTVLAALAIASSTQIAERTDTPMKDFLIMASFCLAHSSNDLGSS